MSKRMYYLLALCLSATAQEVAAETLEEAWLVAAAEDVTIEAAEIRVAAAEAELAAAEGTRWPSLVASALSPQSTVQGSNHHNSLNSQNIATKKTACNSLNRCFCYLNYMQ